MKGKDLRIAYIGGGSRGWAWTFMTDLALEPELGGEVRLYDIDLPAAKANETIGNSLLERPETVGRWRYRVTETLKDALIGADFVVISILPGTFAEMEVDVHLPERLHIWQSVGDTAGPGGIIRALRTLPMYVPIAEGIRDFCPDAWVINYTNPMALCVRMLYHIFPEIKAFGCCHEVFNTQQVLAEAVGKALEIPTPERKDIHVNVLGLNHFTWFDAASYGETDLFPIYRELVDQCYEEGFHEENHNWMNSHFDCAHRVKFDLFRRYGLIAAAGDRHLAEFMPGDWYLKDPGTVKSWKFSLTPVQWREDDLKERLARSRKLVAGEERIDLTPSGEEGILLIKALCGLGRMVSNVNLPNRGQLEGISLGTVVETNAVFDRDSVRPVLAGALPEPIRELVLPHVEIQALTLRAAETGDRDLVVKALQLDPNTAAKCRDTGALRCLADDMITGTSAYLPDIWNA